MIPFAEIPAAISAAWPPLTPLVDIVVIGGPVVWILVLFSVIALAITLLKLVQLIYAGGGKSATTSAISLLREGKPAEAQASLQTQKGPRNVVLGHAMRLLRQGVLSVDEVSAEVARIARVTLSPFESGLRSLEVIATLSPLLGLLGTVLGMIEAFRAMQAAGDQVNPALLSGGIWQALLTTAVGLAVAIPVSLVHSWLERRHEVRTAQVIDDLQQALTVYAETREPLGRVPDRRAA